MALPPDIVRVLVVAAEQLDLAFEPLVRAARHPASLQRLLHQAGWDVQALLTADQQELLGAVDRFEDAVSNVLSGAVAVDEVAQLAATLVDATIALAAAAEELESFVDAALATDAATLGAGAAEVVTTLTSALVADITDHLAVRWLQRTSPTLLSVLRMVGLVTTVRRPSLYLNDPPIQAPTVDPDAEPPTPVRWAMQRQGINRDGLSNPLVLGLLSLLEDLPRDAYRSPATFIAAVQSVLADRLERLSAELTRRPVGELSFAIRGDGLSFTAPNWLPTTLVDWDQTVEFAITDSPPVPLDARIERDTWSVLWAPPGERDLLAVVADTLYLVDRFQAQSQRHPDAVPEVRLTVDVSDPDAVAVTFSMTIGFELRIADGFVDELAITAAATIGPGGAEVVVTAAVLDTAEIPVLVPGLTGMRLGLVEPSLELIVDLDDTPRLDVNASLLGFSVHLPAELFGKAELGPTGWTIVEGASPALTMTVPSDEPLFSLGVASTDDGLAIDRCEILPPPDSSADADEAWSIGFSADPIYIGTGDIASGVVIEIESTVYTASPGALGVLSITEARVHLPPDLPAAPEAIVIEDATIGEAGFSGEVSIAFAQPRDDQDLEPLFGVIPIAFQSIALVIEENLPTAFELKAAIELPYFDEWVDVTISFDDDLNLAFLVESVDPDGITLTKDELLLLNFRSASFEWNAAERRLGLGLSGGLEPLLWNADGLQWPRLDITALEIDQIVPESIGDPVEPPILRFQEAWLDLKDLATLDLFGFHFELNRIGIGYVEATDELWVDLTGSLRLIEQIPIGVGVEGFRITWPRRIYEELGIGSSPTGEPVELTVDEMLALASRIQVRFDGIYLFYGIPQAVEFEGYIRFIKEAAKIGFAGDVALRVPTSGLAIEAGLMVGINFEDPPYPFLYVYFGVLLPTGIPLGQSGLAFRGARGLFGLNVEPDREPEQNPYYDWYKRGPMEGAHPTNKWRDRIWSVALGAGITITTTDGKILGVQGLLALAIPGPIIFVEGKALVFDGYFPIDSPLKALGYFDGTELTTQLNIEASLELVEGVIDVMAGIEAFFDFRNLLNWHFYVGQDEPEDRRIHASFLKLPVIGWLFRADAYLMIDMPAAESVGDFGDLGVEDLTVQSRLGVHIGFEPPAIDLVVASAEVRAVLDGNGLLTINPFLFTGGAELDAVIDLDAFGLVIVGVEASAEMHIEGALPLDVQAAVGVRVDLPVPDFDEVPLVGDELASAFDWFEENVVDLPDVPDHLEVEIPFHWRLDRPPVLDPIVTGVSLEGRFGQGGVDASPGDEPLAVAPVVPLDARPIIRFDQNVNTVDGMAFGGFSSGGFERFTAGQLAFRPTVTGVRVFELPASDYVDGISEEWTLVGSTPGTGDGVEPLWGMFRPAGEMTEGYRANRRALELWCANPFEHLTGSIPLSIPGQTAGSAGVVEPMESLGLDGVAWCDDAAAVERCLDQSRIKQFVVDRMPRPLAEREVGGVWRQRLELGAIGHGLAIVAPDIRPTAIGDRYAIVVDASFRERLATIEFPASVTWARIALADKDVVAVARRRVLTGRVDRGFVVQEIDATVDVDQSSAAVTIIEVSEPAGFDEVVIGGRSALQVLEVCWITVDDAEHAAARAAACEANDVVASWAGEVGVVLSPGSFYRIEVDTSVLMDEEASLGAAALLADLPGFEGGIDPYRSGRGGPLESTDSFLFRTEGPPPDLRPYVAWLSPDEGATGHPTGNDLAIRFNRPYLHRFYPDDDNGAAGPPGSPYALEAIIEDADGRTRTGWFLNWTTAASSTLLPEEAHWYDEVAPEAGAATVPPPDDVLEIRRRLAVRSFADIPTAGWASVSRPGSVTADRRRLPRPNRRPGFRPPTGRRVQWTHRGDEVAVRMHRSSDVHLYLTTDEAWGPATLEVDIEPVVTATIGPIRPTGRAASSAFGVAVLARDEEDHHLVRVRTAALGQPVVEIVRVRGGEETVLASAPVKQELVGRPGRPVEFRLEMRTAGLGMWIGAKVAGTLVEADDPLAPRTGAVGLLASGVDASFGHLAIGSAGDPLDPGTRYQLTLAGGAGGPTRRRDDFTTPVDWWPSTDGWSYGQDGLHASGTGSVLEFGAELDDGEVTTTVVASDGDRLTIGLRTDDDRRGPIASRDRHRYELSVARLAGTASVELRVRRGPNGISTVLASGQVAIGSTRRLTIRVRLIGDRLRAWVFDRQVLEATLGTVTLPDGTEVGLVRRGSLEWRVTDGTPRLRDIHVGEAALLRTGFTTGVSASFGLTLAALDTAAVGQTVTPSSSDALVAAVGEAVTGQRHLAIAIGELHRASRWFALGRAGREDVEVGRQDVMAARAVNDAAVADVLIALGAGPLLAPSEPSLGRVETDSGLIVGWLLRSPEPLDPVRFATDGAVFESVGRTSFELRGVDDEPLATHWVASADGTTVLVYRVAAGVSPGPTVPAPDLAPVLVADLPTELVVRRVRDHGDDDSVLDHLLDRSYELSRGSRADVIRRLGLP